MAPERKRFGTPGPPPKPVRAAPAKRLSTQWPPAVWDVHATLIQPACVKCRRACGTVRVLQCEGEVLWPEDCATVCKECWAVCLAELGNYDGDIAAAFWGCKPVEPTLDCQLMNLLEFAHTKRSAAVWAKFKAGLTAHCQ